MAPNRRKIGFDFDFRWKFHVIFNNFLLISSILFQSCAYYDGLAMAKNINSPIVDDNLPDPIYVHIVPHTHDDAGWLKTVDQYYYGSNNSIQHACVQCILDSTVAALEENPDRRFVYVETSFLYRWWKEQSEEKKNTVRKLAQEGRLEVANGGWVMHDEACAHYIAMVDQTTLGHAFLKQELGVVPTVGWQIDPFGHSSTQASLLSDAVGFKGLFFGRIDYQDREKRIAESRMEMMWQASKSLPHLQVFTGAFHSGNYGAPEGFCFDTLCTDNPIMDDPELKDYNVDEMVEAFVRHCQNEANHTVGSHLMVVMGMDFQYENARMNFKNIDKLIHHVNKDGRVKAFYSTPSKYIDAKLEEMQELGLKYEVKQDDFFPYADCPHCFWTGYFTSRPTLKYQVRHASGYLQAARQLEVWYHALQNWKKSSTTSRWNSPLSHLEQANALVQHHDGVSGTSKQHVAEDYSQRLSQGMDEAMEFTGEVLSLLTGVEGPVVQCKFLNESLCAFTQELEGKFSAIVYNPLAQARNETIVLPVITPGAEVRDEEGKTVESEVYPSSLASPDHILQGYFIAFQAEALPPLGAKTFEVTLLHSPEIPSIDMADGNEDFILYNGIISLHFDPSGALSAISRHDGKNTQTMEIGQGFHYYKTFDNKKEECALYGVDRHLESKERLDSSKHAQNDGAYIFRPADPGARGVPIGREASTVPLKFKIIKGNLVQEVHQYFSNWTKQIIRLRAGDAFAEFEWVVGPIPVGDNIGKAVVSRFTSDIESGSTFYTDSNGREFQERKLNYRPTWELDQTEPVAGNYYPINTAMFIKDDTSQLSILADRSQGGSSLSAGELELMVHRRGLVDDDRGVGEALNETDGSMTHFPTWERHGDGISVRGKHYLLFSDVDDAMAELRFLMDKIFSPPLIGFSKNSKLLKSENVLPFDIEDLPPNIALMTLQVLEENKVLVRLSHQFSVSEDQEYSKETEVDLSKVFRSLQISSMEEVSLTGNQMANDMTPVCEKPGFEKYFDSFLGSWEKAHLRRSGKETLKATKNERQFFIAMKPMQIKTFILTLHSKSIGFQ